MIYYSFANSLIPINIPTRLNVDVIKFEHSPLYNVNITFRQNAYQSTHEWMASGTIDQDDYEFETTEDYRKAVTNWIKLDVDLQLGEKSSEHNIIIDMDNVIDTIMKRTEED